MSQAKAQEQVPPLDARELTAADRECVPELRGVHVGKLLGKGTYKSVYQLCADAKCTSVLPSVLQVIYTETEADLAEIRKERLLMQTIQKLDAQRRWTPIVMPIEAYYECSQNLKSFAIQPQAQENFAELGVRQAQQVLAPVLTKTDPNWKANTSTAQNGIGAVRVYTRKQLAEAFLAARNLYQRYRLIHNDLKPDNIFVWNGRVMLADLGLTGPVRGTFQGAIGKESEGRPGFVVNWGCPADRTNLSPAVRQYQNQWQLEAYFRVIGVTLIIEKLGDDANKLTFFSSVDQLNDPDLLIPPLARVTLDEDCFKVPKDNSDDETESDDDEDADDEDEPERTLQLFNSVENERKQAREAKAFAKQLEEKQVVSLILQYEQQSWGKRKKFQLLVETALDKSFAFDPQAVASMSMDTARTRALLLRDSPLWATLPPAVRRLVNEGFKINHDYTLDAIFIPPSTNTQPTAAPNPVPPIPVAPMPPNPLQQAMMILNGGAAK